MVRSFVTHAQKLFVVLFFLLFVWAAAGGAQFGSPVVEKGPSNSPVCDIYTPVTDASCSSAGMALLLTYLLGGALLLHAGSVFQMLNPASALWRLYLFLYVYTGRFVPSPLHEAFRKGIIHPKIYHFAG